MKDPAAVALGSRGGKARAKIGKKRLHEIAMMGVEARRKLANAKDKA